MRGYTQTPEHIAKRVKRCPPGCRCGKHTPRSLGLQKDVCQVDGCLRGFFSGGYCQPHYNRFRKYGDPLITRQLGPPRRSPGDYPKTCAVPGCSEPHRALGFCGKHYSRLRRSGDPLSLTRSAPGEFSTCQVDACSRPFSRKGFCHSHYQSWIAGPLRARRLRASHTPFTVEQLNQKISMYGDKCWICSSPFQALDHVKPLAKGGAHMLCNLRPICKYCNSQKGDAWPLSLVMERVAA